MRDDSFQQFVMDQLALLPGLRAKAMFGGRGLYQGDHFFGILMDGRIFFKTDAKSSDAYVKRGMEPFTYEKAGRTMTMHYFVVPADVLESRDELVKWAEAAIRVLAPGQRKA